jgi:hypothetical protein
MKVVAFGPDPEQFRAAIEVISRPTAYIAHISIHLCTERSQLCPKYTR